ncbi:MAG: N-acetylmuramoyl-L-alanine amidase [Bacteroidota bacterium]
MKSLIPILDNGHGGMINGVYQTAGKRSPKIEDRVLYEGAYNRWIVNGIIESLDTAGIPYFHISPELRDISLQTRVNRANKIFKQFPNTYLLSIHANIGFGKGTGYEGFTSTGQTPSDDVAEVFLTNFKADFPNERPRFDTYSDGDKDKEASYKILIRTTGRAFLMEMGFMDHLEDNKKLRDKWHRQCQINSLVRSIIELYEGI